MNAVPECFSEKTVRARKPHRCCEGGCKRTEQIGTGQRHEAASGKWDGQFMTIRSCLRCARLRKKVTNRYPPEFHDEGPAYGSLLAYVREVRRGATMVLWALGREKEEAP